MTVRIATDEEIPKLSHLSRELGNIPLFPGQAIASVLENGSGIVGFAAVQSAWIAAGSWVKEEYRKQGLTYQLRKKLDDELRRRGVPVYLALPGNDFEKALFAKYGKVTEHLAQMRHL